MSHQQSSDDFFLQCSFPPKDSGGQTEKHTWTKEVMLVDWSIFEPVTDAAMLASDGPSHKARTKEEAMNIVLSIL